MQRSNNVYSFLFPTFFAYCVFGLWCMAISVLYLNQRWRRPADLIEVCPIDFAQSIQAEARMQFKRVMLCHSAADSFDVLFI
jgi:hypothetical protein